MSKTASQMQINSRNSNRKSYLNSNDILKIIVAICSAIVFFIIRNPENIGWGAIYLLLLNVLFVFKVRRNILVLVVGLFLLWFNYSIYVPLYILKINSFYTLFIYDYVAIIAYRSMLIFISILFVCTKFRSNNNIENVKISLYTRNKTNSLYGSMFIILLILIFLFAFNRPDIKGERSDPTALYEYSIIFFIVSYFLYGKNKKFKLVWSILLILFALQNLIYGGRVTALQLILVLFLMINNNRKLHWKRIVPLVALGIIVFVGIGMFRTDFKFSFYNVKEILNSFAWNGFALDTAYAAYHTALTFLKTESIVGISGRFELFNSFILSLFLGGSVPNSSLPEFTRQYFVHYWGGILPLYGHFYLGYWGVILLALLLSVYMNKMLYVNENSAFWKCASVYLAASIPRWYLYSPSNLIRGMMLLLVVYIIAKLFCVRKKRSYKIRRQQYCHC